MHPTVRELIGYKSGSGGGLGGEVGVEKSVKFDLDKMMRSRPIQVVLVVSLEGRRLVSLNLHSSSPHHSQHFHFSTHQQ